MVTEQAPQGMLGEEKYPLGGKCHHPPKKGFVILYTELWILTYICPLRVLIE